MTSTKVYEKVIDDKTRQHLKSEEELNKMKTDRKHFEYLKTALNGAKARLDKIEKRIETITTK